MIARALTIAGSDPSGGAGVQQDLKTFHALGVWGMSVLTAITAQNTARVERWQAVDPDLIAAQIDAVLADVGADAAKTGMLATAATVQAVARAVVAHRLDRLVVDPVLVATSGDALVDADAAAAIVAELLPRALLVTPNAREAEALSGIAVVDAASQREAARAIAGLGPRAVLVKGGDIGDAHEARDLLLADGDEHVFVAPRVTGGPFHGTGCLLSAAITADLARGAGVPAAVATGKRMVAEALGRALTLGRGSKVLQPRGEVEG